MNKQKAMVFAGLGFELFAIVLGALLIGAAIDEQLDSKPVGTLALLIMCIIGWLIHFIHLVKNYAKDMNENRSD